MVRTVGGRLFLSYLAVVLVGLIAAAVTIAGLLVRYEDEVSRVRLQELGAPLLTAMATALRNNQDPKGIVDARVEQAKSADARLIIITSTRRVLVDSDNVLTQQTLDRTTQGNFGTFNDRGDQWLFVQQVIRPNATGVTPAIIVVARDSRRDRKSTRLNSSHVAISYAVFCLKKKRNFHIRSRCFAPG